jgi:NAD(P)-dependent dehydrogenase (short-subunit alcohol dehydrogenase family)
MAVGLARAGADVAVHYNSSGEGARDTLRQIEAAGQRCAAFKADLSEVEACTGLVDAAAEFLGGLDILVNNAGVSATWDFFKVTPERYDLLYAVNIRAQFFCAQRAAAIMLEQGSGGSIINLTSNHAEVSLPGWSVYAGTKGAVWSWTRQLAVELAPSGIRVNGLCPGWLVVGSHYRETPGFDPVAMGKNVPNGRLGVPEDAAKVCVFMASDDADYMVGHVVVIDGGITARVSMPQHGRETD